MKAKKPMKQNETYMMKEAIRIGDLIAANDASSDTCQGFLVSHAEIAALIIMNAFLGERENHAEIIKSVNSENVREVIDAINDTLAPPGQEQKSEGVRTAIEEIFFSCIRHNGEGIIEDTNYHMPKYYISADQRGISATPFDEDNSLSPRMKEAFLRASEKLGVKPPAIGICNTRMAVNMNDELWLHRSMIVNIWECRHLPVEHIIPHAEGMLKNHYHLKSDDVRST